MSYLKSLVIAATSLVYWSGLAQVPAPAKWTFELSKTDLKGGEEVDVIFKANIDEKWYVYATDFDLACGPLPTVVEFTEIKNFKLVGNLKAINPTSKHEEIFNCDVKIVSKDGEFRQRIKVLGGPLAITGAIQGQVCSSIEGICIAFEKDFSIPAVEVKVKPVN